MLHLDTVTLNVLGHSILYEYNPPTGHIEGSPPGQKWYTNNI